MNDCPHHSKIGDNYGESCLQCGAQLSGYGYGGWFGSNLTEHPTCIHVWAKAGDADDAGEICIYCYEWKVIKKS